MTANELREKYLRFFKEKGHSIIPSAPLVPENDPTVLFTTAGMHPLVPFLLGEKHPMGQRLCNSQKCIRTGDIDNVGDATHCTFLEMLGNWSLGDPASPDGIGKAGYFKKEAIEWSFEFLTKELNIPLEKLAFSVFEGEPANNIPRDSEAAEIWQSLGVSKDRIAYLGRDDNWWGPAGKTGPCGPDTEMFYWTELSLAKAPLSGAPDKFDPSDKRWVEIWNDVFMEYNKQCKVQSAKFKVENKEEYEFVPLAQKNVDTGMGLERVAMILQGKDNVYETELFEPIIREIKKFKVQSSKFKVAVKNSKVDEEKAMRIVADHIKAAAFLLAERLTPSNVERGYVLRRLIRRAVRYGKLLGIEKNFTAGISETVIKIYENVYSELRNNQKFIFDELTREEGKFSVTLSKGLKEFEKAVKQNISGKEAFDLYQSYGFPIEMTGEMAREKNAAVDEQGFQEELKKHQELSRTASAGQFKSGLADNSEATTKYHTATHLLLAALKTILGPEVEQKGSNITAERIRFDFSFGRKMSEEEIKNTENIVNQRIKDDLPVVCEEMETAKAKEQGAVGVFGHKYADRVKVYTIGRQENTHSASSGQVCSKEICAGPHATRTGALGAFKIIKEEAVSAGIRRIKAILKSLVREGKP